jgi:hypothetical protein
MKASNSHAQPAIFGIALACSSLVLFYHHAHAATLTGIIAFSSTQRGDVGRCIWDTSPEGGWVDLNCFHDGKPINNPVNHQVSIAARLHAGTNIITFTGVPDPTYNYFIYQAANLFFDGHILPDISVRGPVCGTPTPCEFTTNTAPATMAMDGTGTPPSPRLDYVTSADKVTLADYQFSPGYNGTITLVVEPTLELLSVRISEVEITWPSLSNVTYQVQYASSLTSNVFQPIGEPIPGNGHTNFFRAAVPAGEPQRFYRVFRVP